MKDFKFNRKANQARLYRDMSNPQMVRHNQLNRDFVPTDEDAMEYTKDMTNRQQAQALLAKLKAKEAQGMAATKVFWVDGQPTLVESSSKMQWDQRITKLGFGRPENKGLPATDSNPRVPAGWEAKMDRKRRRQYTLAETPTMTFTGSAGFLGPEYYQDEEQLEAYIQSLENDNDE